MGPISNSLTHPMAADAIGDYLIDKHMWKLSVWL